MCNICIFKERCPNLQKHTISLNVTQYGIRKCNLTLKHPQLITETLVHSSGERMELRGTEEALGFSELLQCVPP